MWDIMWFINTMFYFKMLIKDDDHDFFMCGKFWISYIICAEAIANKSFSKGKPIRPMA